MKVTCLCDGSKYECNVQVTDNIVSMMMRCFALCLKDIKTRNIGTKLVPQINFDISLMILIEYYLK